MADSSVLAQPMLSVRVVDLSGESKTGKLTELSDFKVRLASEPPGEWNRADVLRIDWPSSSESKEGSSPQLMLANGDRLGIRPIGINEESLQGRWEAFPAWPELKVPLETVRGVLLLPPRGPLERSEALVRLRDQRETQDSFYLANGDRLLGQLDGFEGDSFQLTAATGKVNLPVGSVRAFGMNPELSSFPAAKGALSILSLTDGSLLTVTNVRYDGKSLLKCQAAFGQEMEFPVEHLISLQFLGDRIVYFDDIDPVEYTSTPYLSRTWVLRRNQNAVGGPLRLGTKEYARGLGMHSQAVATYQLDGKFLSFRTTIGIDAVTEGRGSVIFRVLADGKPVFTSDVVRGKTPPIAVGPLDLKGVQKLTLAVDFADHGDVLDHADWCDAVLIKAP